MVDLYKNRVTISSLKISVNIDKLSNNKSRILNL